jgi:hypothetical protein
MAPKRASSKAAPFVDEAAKAALLVEKKCKAPVDTTHQESCEDDAVSKRQRNDQPTLEGSLRTCSSGGQPQEPPPGFAPLEGEDATEDGEVIGVQQKNNYSCGPCASRTATSRSKKRSSRPSANVSLRRPRFARRYETRSRGLRNSSKRLCSCSAKANMICSAARPSNSALQSKTYSILSPSSHLIMANSLTARTSGTSASPLAPSLPSPQYITHNLTASWSAPMARFSRPSRKCFSTTRREMGRPAT